MKQHKKHNKKNTEKSFNRTIIIAYAVIGCLIGVIFIFLSYYCDRMENILGKFTNVFSGFGSLIISISSGSLLLELFGYVNYTRKRMCEILCEDDVLNVLTVPRKKELKTALLNNLYMPNKDLGDNNIVQVIDNEMDNILKDYYFKEYIMYVDISIIEIAGIKYIKKEIKKTYEAETINNQECVIDNLLKIQISPVNGIEPVKLDYLNINNKEITGMNLQEENNYNEISNHYDSVYYIDTQKIQENLKFSEKISIDLKYTTITEITDKIFSNQIDKPCKHYCIHFNYDSSLELDIVGFCFMTNNDKSKKRIVKTKNGHMLRFLTWILPGDGVMAVITMK